MATRDEIKEQRVEEKPVKPRINFLPGSETIHASDFVRIRSNESGFYLYFCNADPDEKGAVKCQTQVFLPPKVAASLATLLLYHASMYQEKYKTRIIPESVNIQTEEKPESKS